MKTVVLDANLIVRYVLGDNPKLSKEAWVVIKENRLYVDEVILAEVIWVLGSVYGKANDWIATVMKQFIELNRVVNPRKGLIVDALDMFSANNFSYIDCWIYVMSRELGIDLAT